MPAAARGFNHEYIAGLHGGGGDETQLFMPTVRADYVVSSALPGFAASGAERRDDTVIRQDRGRHRFEEPDFADGAVAAMPGAFTAGIGLDFIAVELYRITPLEDFRIGKTRVGHV